MFQFVGLHLPRRTPGARLSTPTRVLATQLISLAGLVGRPVINQSGSEIGTLRDVVVRWDDSLYPAVTGLVVRVGRRASFLPVSRLATIDRDGVALRSAKLDLRDFERREGEITLGRDVLDHQLIDVDGVRVVRASDLYLTSFAGTYRLVGVDVGFNSLARRLGPARWRALPTPSRVIDWATIQPIAWPGEPVRIGRTRQALHRRRPAELAELVEELGATHGQAFVAALDRGVAADVLEEMDVGQVDELLNEMTRERAADLIAAMAPDEAAEALREMDDDDREAVMQQLAPNVRIGLSKLLAYELGTAGSVMTTTMVVVTSTVTVDEVIAMLTRRTEDRMEIDGVLVVDEDGALVDDVSLYDLLVAPRASTLASLVSPPFPATVHEADELGDVLSVFIDSRDTSVVVIDDASRPVGRILADDVIDALVADRRLARRAS
ncbi:MAG: magnesium transporter MgtE N-terminal domain-containing protein [Ilumatobacteraceae bacterium]